MNLENYRNFIKIIDNGTISGASRELHIAQPALSSQLKSLEDLYGAQLIRRGARHLTPTNAGTILYEKARRITQIADDAQKEIQANIAGTRGTLRLALTPAYPDPVMSELLLDFSEAYPKIDFDIIEAPSQELLNMLQNELVEIAVVRTPAQLAPIFHTAHFLDEHLMVAYHKKNPWLSPKLDAIPLTALDGVPLCLSRGFKQQIIDRCLEAGFQPTIHSVSTSRYMALMWAGRGNAVSIFVKSLQGEQPDNSLCIRPLLGPNMDTRRSFITLKERTSSAVAKVFLQFVKQKIG